MSDNNKKQIDSQIQREKKKKQQGLPEGKGQNNGRGLRGMKYYIQNK